MPILIASNPNQGAALYGTLSGTGNPNLDGHEIGVVSLLDQNGNPYNGNNLRTLSPADTVTAVLQNTTNGLDGSVNAGDMAAPSYYYNGDTGFGRYDRVRSVMGLLLSAATISTGNTQGSNQVTVSATPTGLQPGMIVGLFGGANSEALYVQSVVGTTVTFTSNQQIGGHTQIKWDQFSINGPGFSPFIPFGTGLQMLAAYGTAVGAPYAELLRAADGDAMSGSNLLGVMAGLYNGSTSDRQRGVTVIHNIAAQSITAGTPFAAWSPSGKSFRLLGFALSLSVAGSVILKDASTEFMRTPVLPANSPFVQPPFPNGRLSSAPGNVLGVDVSASGSVSGYLYGNEE